MKNKTQSAKAKSSGKKKAQPLAKKKAAISKKEARPVGKEKASAPSQKTKKGVNKAKDNKLILRLDTNPEKPIPFTMLGDLLTAHQRILEVAARSSGKNTTIPELEVTRVSEGSIVIEGAAFYMQMLAPFAKPLFIVMAEIIKSNLVKDEKISVTKEYKISRDLAKKLSDPVAAGHLMSLIAQADGKELYKLDRANIKPIAEESLSLIEEDSSTERGEPVSLEGELIEMNWKTRRGKIKTDFSGKNKQFECYVEDDEFVQNEKIGISTRILAQGTPLLKIGPFGVKELKLLLLDNLIIIKSQSAKSD